MDSVWGETLRNGVSFVNQSIATELLFKGGRCLGAVLFSERKGEFVAVCAKATVFATGGDGQIFQVTTNCRQNTGDGLAIVLDAGLPVMDLEAVQFHPTGIVGPGILASETLRSVGGILRNRDLEPFMEKYAPKMKELAPRDLVARAIETEIQEGRGIMNSDHHIEHVWIDLRHLSDYVHEVEIPEVTSFFKKFVNIDPKIELCPVRPSNHYQMGGIPTTEFGEVQNASGEIIRGLYAVGECAAASFHGFNRLGTNSILELITMGRFVGQRVVESLADQLPELPAEAAKKSFALFSAYLDQTGKENLEKIRQESRALMTEKVGVFRTEVGLAEAIETLKALKERAADATLACKSLKMNPELILRWELENLLAVSIVTAMCALKRRESRGGHARKDFPERKDEFNYHTLATMTEFAKVDLTKRAVDMSIFDSKCEHCERFGIIERTY
jgi:succinate dehydrogenase / fumarate reductase flavoprotein subunit